MNHNLVCRWATCCLVACSIASSVQAELIKPAGVAATSFWSNGQHPLNLINGSGLSSESAAATHAEGFGDIWHSDAGYATTGGGAVVANQSVTFTLPGAYDLTQAHIWQLNQPGLPGRGVNQYDLLVSSDGVNFAPALSDANLAASAGGPIGAQSPAVVQNNVRFVKLQIDSAHSGGAVEYVGLSEVRFEGTLLSAGPVVTTSAAATSAGLPRQPAAADLLAGRTASSSSHTVYDLNGTFGKLTDGAGDSGFAPDYRVVPSQNDGIWQLEYSAAALGLSAGESLSINMIDVFGFNTDDRRFADFDVYYSIDDVTWQALFLGAANATTVGGDVLLTSIAREDSLDMVDGVRGLRFDFRPVTGVYDGGIWSAYHSSLVEIDVHGALVPEPSGLVALLAGGVALLKFRRRSSR